MGYTFADNVTAEQKSDICQLLVKWGGRSEDERERVDSSLSAKAPGGEVILFSGVVPYVHNSKTKHLWVPVNVPPPPAAAPPPRQGTRVGRYEPGTNPWRGTTGDADRFEKISIDRKYLSRLKTEEVGNTSTHGGPETGGAAKYLVDDSSLRNRRGKSSASEENEGELAERESRLASEPGVPTRSKTTRKHAAGGKGRTRRCGSTGRRGRGQSDSQGDEPEERTRTQSEATDSTPRGASIASDLPRNQHRKLRPLAMEAQNKHVTVEKPPKAKDSADGTPAVILTPSAPSKIKPSKVLRTYW